MRLWSVHPKVLDQKALVACWRESLLAQAVLGGLTRGYQHHPQLQRWRAHETPLAALGGYLAALWWEADRRGYHFNAAKILIPPPHFPQVLPLPTELCMEVTRDQLRFELAHLRAKITQRAPDELSRVAALTDPPCAPSFYLVAGGVADWERGKHNV